MIRANVRNKMYKKNIMTPKPFVIFQLLHAMVEMTARSIPTSTRMFHRRLLALTGLPVYAVPFDNFIMLLSNQGKGSPIRMSKMLLPIELETAISPFPCIATMTLLSKSGTLVPAASKVRPMTTEGIRHTQPMTVAHHTMKSEKQRNKKYKKMSIRVNEQQQQ